MGFIKEFREFALKGNVIDLAVAVIIGAAFGAIISSLVDDVITPLLLTPALEAANAQDLDKLTWGAVKYGKFLAAVIKFILVALVLFLLIKGINRMNEKKKAIEPAPELTMSEKLLVEIRDGLKSKQ
jgi:large conductance mechanosensitive channel